MTNLDVCERGPRKAHTPFENPVRPLHHGIQATCHRCKIHVWWDASAEQDGWIGKWRSHKIIEWP